MVRRRATPPRAKRTGRAAIGIGAVMRSDSGLK